MNRRQLLAGVALLAAGAIHRRRSRLLAEDSRPPDFTLPDGTGRLTSLHEFLGRKRVVLVFRAPRAALSRVRDSSAAYAERDVVVLAVDPPGGPVTAKSPLYSLTDPTGATLRAYGAEGPEVAFYLIGKDGGVKMARHDIPSDEELFAVIDAMPMRRQEMRDQRK